MFIASLNVGGSQPMPTKSGLSGIFKTPVAGMVRIGREGLADDFIADLDHHGGVDQAVYVYTVPDYGWWGAELGRELEPGLFGENILLSEMTSGQMGIGDQFRFGDVVLEVTSYRMPCATLAARMGDRGFVKRFNSVPRHGAYCRVLGEGDAQVGMKVENVAFAGARVTLREMAERYPYQPGDREFIARLRQTPVHWKVLRDLDGFGSQT